MNYIFYQTKTNFSNTGDSFINKSLISELRNYGTIVANCSSDIPHSFIASLGIRDDEKIICDSEFSFVKNVLKYAFKSLFKHDKVFIFSGLGDSFGGGFKPILRNFLSFPIFLVYRIFGVKIIRIGRSIGPMTRMMYFSEKVRSIFINYYYVRDSISLKKCHDIGIKKAKLCPDMSWLYNEHSSRNINFDNKNILVNVRNAILDSSTNEYKELLTNSILKVIDCLHNLDNDYNFIFCYQVDEDKEYVNYLYNIVKKKYSCSYLSKKITMDNIEDVYSNSIINISNRMHSLLLGYKFGTLPLAIIDKKNHIKITGTLVDNDLEDILFDINNLDLSTIKDLYCNDKTALYNKIINIEKYNQEQIRNILDFIFNVQVL